MRKRQTSDDTATVTVFKLFAAAAGAGVIASRQFLFDDGLRCLLTCVVSGSLFLCFVFEALVALGVFGLRRFGGGGCLFDFFGSLRRYLCAC